jgi:outer membrane protein assembly factor BamB
MMNSRRRSFVTRGTHATRVALGLGWAAAVCILPAAPRGAWADWPHWRGPNRNGIVAEDSRWSSGGWPPRELWKASVGEGSTSPLIVAGRVYVLGWRGGEDHLRCLDAASGAERWSTRYKAPRYGRHATGDEGIYSGISSTPEFDPQTGYLYTLGIDGELNCWDTGQRGQRVWNVNLYDRYQSPQRPRVGRSGLRDYGYTSSPLVHDAWLIVEAGGPQGSVVALDKRTGRHIWGSQDTSPPGHTGGPVPMTVEGVPCVAVMTFRGLLVVRLDRGHQGQTVADYEWITSFANNIATPAVHENSVLITSGYNHDAICKLEITLSGGARKLWEQRYASKVCSPIVYNGRVYWAWQQARCLDLADGAQRWAGGQFGDAGSCVVTSDGRMIIWGSRGRLALVETAERSPGQYKELARIDNVFATDAWPHVALSDGRLFCKDRAGNLKCFTLTGK